MNVGQRLKQIRLKRNLTLAEVANRVHKTEATIQRYESGGIRNLKLDIIEELAKVYNVSPATIMGWEREESLLNSKYPYIPVSISAGIPSEVDGISDEQIETITIPDSIMGKWAGSEDIFIVQVNGESMNRIIPDKSLIAVKKIKVNELEDKDIVVFSNGYEYSVKYFYNDKENKRFIFRPDSSDRSFVDYVVPYELAHDLKLHGKVVLYIVNQD